VNGIQVTEGYALNFADPTLHPYSFSSNCFGGSGDLYVGCEAVGSSQQLTVIPGRAGFSQCQADTRFFSSPLFYGNGQLQTGHTLCVTTDNAIAVCYVTQDTTQNSGASPQGLTMDITVYMK
jgi:hypothetical protein